MTSSVIATTARTGPDQPLGSRGDAFWGFVRLSPWAWTSLLALAGLAWWSTVGAAEGMWNMPGTMGMSLPSFVGMWVVMMSAMMLPSVAPVATVYLRAVKRTSSLPGAWLRGTLLLWGYFTAWAAYGAAAFGAAYLVGRIVAEAQSAAIWLGAGVLFGAGAYQLTDLKNSCLNHCRSPTAFVVKCRSFSGPTRDFKAGIYHGGFCVGCCWSLMIVLVAVGVMNLVWMAAIAFVIFLEKVTPYGRKTAVGVGVGLMSFAIVMLWLPGLVPALQQAPMMDMGMTVLEGAASSMTTP